MFQGNETAAGSFSCDAIVPSESKATDFTMYLFFVDLTDYPARITYCQTIGRNIFGYDTSGSDYTPFADSHSG